MPSITLTRLTGFDRNKKTPLNQDRVVLGTDAGADLRFDPTWDKTVSARHLTLEFKQGEWWTRDSSKDGTFLGGRKLAEEILTPGAVLELGRGGPKVQVDFVHVPAAPVAPSVATKPTVVAEPPPLPVTPPRAASAGKKGAPVGIFVGAAVVMLAALSAGAWWWQSQAAKPGATTTTTIAAGTWEPTVLLGGQIFPSYLIASATVPADKLPVAQIANRLGDPVGVIGVSLTSPENGATVTVEFEPTTIYQRSSVTVTLPEKGKTYFVSPKMNYNYEVLLRTKQAVPITLVSNVAFGSQKPASKSITVRLSPINDCPFIVAESGDARGAQWMGWMFAAYVNENHPWSDDLRKEALKSGIIDSFIGYQGDADDVVAQVFAIWHVLQKRGFKYSNITTTSGKDVEAVGVQQVRFLDQAVQGAQANCVDGSVLFASILRQIGIDSVLVLVPGHMFLGFYVSPGNPESILYLETTMMGSADIASIQALKSGPTKILSNLQKVAASKDPKVAVSFDSFTAALKSGSQTAQKFQEDFDKPGKIAKKISVQEARNMGVLPIAYQP
jgi:hypothetical protein